MAKKTAPVQATQEEDEELPQTAVKPSTKELLLRALHEKNEAAQEPEITEQEQPPPPATTQEEETYKKRYGDLRRYAQQKEAEKAQKITELETQIAQLQAAANQPMPKTMEEFEAWKEKYPDIVKFIEIIAEQKSGAASKMLQEELGEVKEKLTLTEQAKAKATLRALVPDTDAITEDPAFKQWFVEQPMFVQEALNTSEDPHTVAYYLNLYKELKKPATAPKSGVIDALSVSTKNSGASPSTSAKQWKFTQGQIAKMSTQEYEQREAEILEARKNGQIFDDLSKRNSVFEV
jgi:hypothetical protein